MGKKKINLGSPSEHSKKWDKRERKFERQVVGGKDDGYKRPWGYDLGKRRKKSLLDRLRGR